MFKTLMPVISHHSVLTVNTFIIVPVTAVTPPLIPHVTGGQMFPYTVGKAFSNAFCTGVLQN